MVFLRGAVFTKLTDLSRFLVNMNAHMSFIALFIVVYNLLVPASLSAVHLVFHFSRLMTCLDVVQHVVFLRGISKAGS